MRIAIIGGGAAAISLLHQLIGKLSELASRAEPIEICIIEKRGEIGPGLAYATTDPSHILNLPAKIMSPLPEDPAHFFNWALEHKHLWQSKFPTIDIEKCAFPPRALYGVYLQWLLVDLIAKAGQQNISVKQLVNHEAVDVKQEAYSGGYRVVFAGNDSPPLLCQKVILNVGHLESENFCQFKDNPSYVHSPWPIETLKKIPQNGTVFIAGTRLTAVDVVLSLKANGHRGNILLGSRLGLLPCVIGNVDSSFNKKHLTYENILALSDYGTKKLELDQVIALFLKEIESDPAKANSTPRFKFDLERAVNPDISAYDLLRAEIEEVKTGNQRHWQNVLFSLYSNISFIWNSLSERAKETFINKYYSAWMTYLAAFPVENAEKIFSLLTQKEIEVKGGLQQVAYDAEEEVFNVTFKDQIVQCQYFINATGAGHDISKTPSLLLQNMVKSGLLVPYHLGGVKVDFKSLQPISKECVIGLFVMGDSGTHGVCMATADLSQSGKQATRIANTIEEQLRLTPALIREIRTSKRLSSEVPPSLMFRGLARSASENNLNTQKPQQQQMSSSAPPSILH